MKTGLSIYKKYRFFLAYLNLFRFWLRKTLIGFDTSNLLLQRIDKISLVLILKKYGATIGQNCDINTGLILHNCKDYTNLVVGNNSHIGKNCFFDLRGSIIIEDNVVISMLTTIITHQDISKSELRKVYPESTANVYIKSNSYIGVRATILKGVIINEFAVVAAGSVVINKVNSFKLVAGVPAKEVKKIIDMRMVRKVC